MAARIARRFVGKVAIITGAAQGMGRRTAADMAAEGAKVVVSDVLPEPLEAARKEIVSAGGECIAAVCDVSRRKQVDDMIRTTVDSFGTVDILVNNAGLLLTGAIEELTDDIIDSTLDINVKGVLYAIRAVVPIMKAKRYGRIVNVASITGKNGDNTTFPVYGASKGAVITLTRSMARALGPFGVTVNAIAPHAVMTTMMSYWDDEKKKSISDRIPVRRLGTVEDMSHLMMFLASDESSFITGETININGGYYMD
jgi:3-oxoacyl-[acyl-carrier protein] reductase